MFFSMDDFFAVRHKTLLAFGLTLFLKCAGPSSWPLMVFSDVGTDQSYLITKQGTVSDDFYNKTDGNLSEKEWSF